MQKAGENLRKSCLSVLIKLYHTGRNNTDKIDFFCYYKKISIVNNANQLEIFSHLHDLLVWNFFDRYALICSEVSLYWSTFIHRKQTIEHNTNQIKLNDHFIERLDIEHSICNDLRIFMLMTLVIVLHSMFDNLVYAFYYPFVLQRSFLISIFIFVTL